MKFIYNGSSKGLFYFLRSQSLIKNVKITSKSESILKPGDFCYSPYSGKPPSSLIDGDKTTCWTNTENINHQFFIIDLSNIKFKLSGVRIFIVCNPPHTVTIKGSNDNINFENITSYSSFFDDSYSYFDAKARKQYRYYRVSQNYPKNLPSYYRFHLAEIEFFGKIGDDESYSIKKCNSFIYLIIYLIVS